MHMSFLRKVFFIAFSASHMLVAINCRHHVPSVKMVTEPTVKKKSALPVDRIRLQSEALDAFVTNETLSPGKAILLEFPYFGPFKSEQLTCNGGAIPVFHAQKKAKAFAFISQSYFDDNEKFSCTFSFGDAEGSSTHSHEIRGLHFAAIDYPEEELSVDRKEIILSAKDRKRVKKESQLLLEVFENSSQTILFGAPFVAPLSSKITSAFGIRRVFNGIKRTQHLGTDFRARSGTKVKSANNGRVVFAGDLFFDGRMVIIDHGLGVFTIYSHLSKILAKVGDKVTHETTIGLSGGSGRTNGPHLHWGVKIHGHWIDGFSVIEASKKFAAL